MTVTKATLTAHDIDAIVTGKDGDLFSKLGIHEAGTGYVLRAFVPGATTLDVVTAAPNDVTTALEQVHPEGLFEAHFAVAPQAYILRATNSQATWLVEDPYRFGPVFGSWDEHLFAEGTHEQLWNMLGAHPCQHEGADGVRFAVWAPNAQRVSVVGGFNDWDGRKHVMRARGATGVWELFVPGLAEGEAYKYEIKAADGTLLPLKADPVAFGSEHPPKQASIVRDLRRYGWYDDAWMTTRAARHSSTQPISIYEVHLSSWRRRSNEGNRPLSYHELARELIPYVKDLGFTHIEVLPISEYPFDGSWGYQPTGMFAPTIRHGTADEFRSFVEACHDADLGLILDWVPGHFPADDHGLAKFDGTALYEYADPREGFHQDWNTLIYNYGRREVLNFLVANARYWLKEFHIDGLRVDAVASMLYRDYSRKPGEWVPNIHGGRENLEAIAFLQRMNTEVYGQDASIMTIAEESTAFPGVTRPVHHDGLGFGFKWNMGWMHDTLEYMKADPIYRRHEHGKITFGLHYAFSENFVLPLSHDEVVHGKGSLIGKMPGSDADKFANLRAYYALMWAHPGKKLLFMGGEIAQRSEWNHDATVVWDHLNDPKHAGIQSLVRDLNAIYRQMPALHQRDVREDGFEWLEIEAADESVFAWLRRGEDGAAPVVCIFNMTPIERTGWTLGVPHAGVWRERLNSDAAIYGGGNRGNMGGVASEPVPTKGQPHCITLTLPPLTGLYFSLDEGTG
ncbi:MAG: 1,4-alpha-glucan branching protein GlgB [Pseudomonadota bacterium]